MDFLQFLSAFGLGAIVTALVQAWLSQKAAKDERNFQEKKECYLGLLEAYRKACLLGSDVEKEFGYWSARCALAAPENIRDMIEQMKTSDFSKQEEVFKHLQSAMRKDLGVQPR